MNRIILFLVFASVLVLGAGCSSNQKPSADGLFIGSNNEQGAAPILSNSGSPLPSPAQRPTQLGPQ